MALGLGIAKFTEVVGEGVELKAHDVGGEGTLPEPLRDFRRQFGLGQAAMAGPAIWA